MNVVYVVWGRRENAEDWQEELLAERPTRETAQAIVRLAQIDGWVGCRIARMDLSIAPTFGANLLNV
jgi:succinylarginine dihydrolase